MGDKYSSIAPSVASGTNKTLITLVQPASANVRRTRLYEMIIGSEATPADQAAQLTVLRCTTAGTSAANFTPNPLDASAPASTVVSGQGAFSGEPTYTANSNLLMISVNQRATFRWIVNPGYELMGPVTASNGLGLRSLLSTSTQTLDSSISWEE